MSGLLNMSTVMICAALVGALVLATRHRPAGLPIVAVVVAAIEALSAFHIVRLSVERVPIMVVLGAALAIVGAACWVRAAGRSTISAATVVTMVGALQVAGGLRLLHG